MTWKLKPERMVDTNFGGKVPSWSMAINRMHALGQLRADGYVHARAGEMTRAFCRRIRRVERKARRFGLAELAKLARTFRGGARRYGFRGATDMWTESVRGAAKGMIRKVLCGYVGDALRRAEFLACIISNALEELCGPLQNPPSNKQDVPALSNQETTE